MAYFYLTSFNRPPKLKTFNLIMAAKPDVHEKILNLNGFF